MLAVADPELAARLRSERNQGRAPDMDWVDHDRLGFNYRLTEIQAALGIAQLERLDELLAARERAAALYERAPRRARLRRTRGRGRPGGLVLPCADRGRGSVAAGSSTPSGCPPGPTATPSRRPRAARRRAKAYMPAIHLLAHMRERFGFREGQFPVAEDASERLLALPFFAEISEEQIDRVCEALAEALRGDWT